ncbi:MAG: dATP/dGTP diphosphohydrolase domain-containing protein, partial [Sedimentisphaerales bacterium]
SDLPYRADLLDGPAILTLSRILKEGADKYGVDNWRLIPARSHINHVFTHLFAHQSGDTQDEHLAHAFCRMMFAVALDGESPPCSHDVICTDIPGTCAACGQRTCPPSKGEDSFGNSMEYVPPGPPIGMYTHVGRWINPGDLQPEDVVLTDIAHALANTCRFGGHCRQFYSVAEHSVTVSRLVPSADARWGLLHDAAEAYLTDLPSGVKQYCPDYRRLEERALEVIAMVFNLSPGGPPFSVHAIEQGLVADEMRWLFPSRADTEEVRVVSFGGKPPLTPDLAKALFLQRFKELWDD